MTILFTIIALSVLILIHELGHFLTAKFFGVKVEEFGIGFPPRLISKKIGETVYSLNLLPFGGFVKIFGEDGISEEKNNPNSFVSQPIWRRSVIILAGIFMNIFLGWLILSIVFMIGIPQHLAIAEVAVDSPAKIAGLQSGDIILKASYNGVILSDPIKSKELIDLVNQAAGNEVLFTVKRGDKVFETALQSRVKPPAGQGPVGVALVEIGFSAQGFFKSLIKSFNVTISTLKAIAFGFVAFLGSIFVDKNAFEAVAGPVGIFSIAAQASSLGLVYFLQFMALISLNLAVLNLVPFPALDGGRFLFLLIEKIKGSPVSSRLQIIVNSFGLLILIILMIIVTIKDINRLF